MASELVEALPDELRAVSRTMREELPTFEVKAADLYMTSDLARRICDEAADRITALEAEAALLRKVFVKLDEGRDAPGHFHDVPGIWDADNGDKAGQKCEWCAEWSAIRALDPQAGKGEQQ